MRRLKIAFLLNPLRDMRHRDDTSFAIMAECQKRGHLLYFLESRDLLFCKKRVHGRVFPCRTDPRRGLRLSQPVLWDLRRLDILWVRKEPPFDLDYLHGTYLLDLLKPHVFLINDPTGIRSTNEKLSILNFPRYAPRSSVGYRAVLLRQGIRSLGGGPLVLKRLENKGGKDVLKSHPRDRGLKSTLRRLNPSENVALLAQEFIPHQKSGDKRILILDGKPLGAFTRIPGDGDFRANMALGARAARAPVTRADKALVLALKPYLKKNGLHFTGIDVLKDRLTEINVTSPAGIPEINGFERTRLEEPVVDFTESQI